MTDRRPSWLELEQYALGELGPDRARALREHLARDPQAAAAYQSIEDDPPLMLPPLPKAPARRSWTAWAWPTLALATAGLTLVVLGDGGPELRTKGAPARPVLTLVAERGGKVRTDPSRVLPEDRLRLLSTYDGPNTSYDLVVREGTLNSFPLSRGTRLPRGNRVPLPGAFQIDARGEVDVCLVVGPELPSRRDLSRRRTSSEVCVSVQARGR